MKHEVTTLNTKKTLAASLKKFMEKKPLSKITVSEIIKDCGVNRKTFYYHFEDIYVLLKWMLEEEAFNVFKNFDLMIEYQEAILFVMQYLEDNKHILVCACDPAGRETLKRVLCSDFHGIMQTIIDQSEEEHGLSVPKDFKHFLTIMFTEAIVGMIIDWLHTKDEIDKNCTIKYMSLLLRSSLPIMLEQGQTLD